MCSLCLSEHLTILALGVVHICWVPLSIKALSASDVQYNNDSRFFFFDYDIL